MLSKYAASKAYDPEIHTYYWAAENNHLDVIKYLHEVIKINFSEDAMDLAVSFGHLEIIKYLEYVLPTADSNF